MMAAPNPAATSATCVACSHAAAVALEEALSQFVFQLRELL